MPSPLYSPTKFEEYALLFSIVFPPTYYKFDGVILAAGLPKSKTNIVGCKIFLQLFFSTYLYSGLAPHH